MNFSSAKRQMKRFGNLQTSSDSSQSTSHTMLFSSVSAESSLVQFSETDAAIALDSSTVSSASCLTASSQIPVPTAAEINDFYVDLSRCGHLPALLSLVSPFSESYVTETANLLNVKPLNTLFNKGYISFTVGELQTMADSIDVSVSEFDIEGVEMMTRGQSSCKDWFKYRAGRITASKLKDVCCTDLSKPSVSLLKVICYPLNRSFKTAATEWGVSKEKVALNKYRESLSNHTDVLVEQCGFFISFDHPFMGASPDSSISCFCCGRGVVEVKCPHKYRSSEVTDYVVSSDSCFLLINDELQLNNKHRYYYQVQAEMHICDVTFCDFVCVHISI
jgi:hypothetical protein